MERQPVTSSNIDSIGYDPEKRVLEVAFKNGVYQYADVPESAFQNLLVAPSVGAAFHATIKGRFAHQKIG